MNTPVGENPRGGTAWAEVRADNGHPEPYGIRYWEVGNELAGEKTFWIGPGTTLAERAPKYIFGGSNRFTKQLVHTEDDYTPSGSVSSGKPNQNFFVRFPPVEPDSHTVYVGGAPWSSVDDLSSAGAENVYEFDPQEGRITFGDGEHGNIPEKGARITITHVSGPHDGFVDFYREMKEVDPSIEVGSALNAPIFTEMMGSEHPYDFLVAHSYSYFRETPSGLPQLHDLMMTLPDVQADKVEVVLDQIDRDAGERAEDVDLVITEWAMATGFNIGLGRIDAPLPYAQTLDGALYTGLVLRHWLRLGIPVAQRHALIDINLKDPPPGYTKKRTAYQAIVGPHPCFLITAPALVYRMFTRMTGDATVSSEVRGNPIKTIFNGSELGSLATIASTDADDNLFLIVINSNFEDHVATDIQIDGFSPLGSGRAWTLTGSDFLAFNTIKHPNRVRIASTELEDVAGKFAYRFPPLSITALELEGAGD
jgi:alpha-N-arabinofuranosidase